MSGLGQIVRTMIFLAMTVTLVGSVAWCRPVAANTSNDSTVSTSDGGTEDRPQPSPPAPICTKRPCIITVALVGDVQDESLPRARLHFKQANEEKADEIVFVIASPGGDFAASAEIASMLRDTKVPTYCIATKVAASGAFWILEGCQHRIVTADTILLTHQVYFALGQFKDNSLNATQLREFASQLDASNKVMGDFIAKRMGITYEQWYSHVEKTDWIIDTDDAVGLHVVDVVVPDLAAAYRLIPGMSKKVGDASVSPK